MFAAQDYDKMFYMKFLFWAPRTLAILCIFFLGIFALDIFGGNNSFFETAFALFLHLIPSLVLFVALIIIWRKPLLGSVVFFFLAVFFTFYFNAYRHLISFFTISFPLAVIGILFFGDYLAAKKRNNIEKFS